MNIDKRENIEWLNCWIEDAGTYKKRIILLGDSVTREIRKKLQFYTNKKYAVDLIAMSYCILDCMALMEIKHYFQATPYEYEYIFYQMGTHHGYHIACAESVEDSENFAGKTVEILNFLKQHSSNVIAVSSTLERSSDQAGKHLFNHNREIVKRNQLLEKAAEKMQIAFLDLNKKIDNRVFQYLDWCHFYEECYEVIAKVFIEDFFADVKYIPSNQIRTVKELDRKLERYEDKKIYIYGNGVRGRRMRTYLCDKGYRFDGFVVSKEYKETADQVLELNDIEKNDALVIVTPIDIDVWEKLNQSRVDYITVHSDVNTFLRMYTGM